MNSIGFDVESLALVDPNPRGDSIYLEARMTEEQMFHAVQQFQAKITQETWDRWLERIAEEAS